MDIVNRVDDYNSVVTLSHPEMDTFNIMKKDWLFGHNPKIN